jgi:hypothetical protein
MSEKQQRAGPVRTAVIPATREVRQEGDHVSEKRITKKGQVE